MRLLLPAGIERLPQKVTSPVKRRNPDGRMTIVARHRKDIKAGTLSGINIFFSDFLGWTSGGDNATEAALNAVDALSLSLEDWVGPLPPPSRLDAPLIAEADPLCRVLIPYEVVVKPELVAA